MSNEPSPAVGTARRSFWIAVFGGLCSLACRVDVLGRVVQSTLNLLAAACLLIAFAFGAVALIRMRSTDRNAVVIPALAGLLLGLALLANLSNWGRDQWVKARLQARAAGEASPVVERPTPTATPPPQPVVKAVVKSVVKYEFPLLDQIPDTVAGVRASATRAQEDEAVVLRVWASHLEKIQTAYGNTFAASNQLHEIDLLDPKLISNLKEDEAVARRGLANKYSDAWRELGQKLSVFPGAYQNSLYGARVPSDRAGVESQSLFSLVEQPDVAARLASLQKLCKAEQDVGRHYNYAVSAVFQYATIASKVPNPPAHFREQMDGQIRKLKEVEQAAAASRREAFPKTDQGP